MSANSKGQLMPSLATDRLADDTVLTVKLEYTVIGLVNGSINTDWVHKGK